MSEFPKVLRNAAGDERIAYTPSGEVSLGWDGYKPVPAELKAADDPRQRERQDDVDAEKARKDAEDAKKARKPRPTPPAPKN
jgi:hypothetical protein